MSELVQQVNQKLWKMHRDTKKLLTFFLPKTDPYGTDSYLPSDVVSTEEPPEEPKLNKAQKIGLILGPLLFFITLFFVSPKGMSHEAVGILASTLWIATWWVTEAIPIPATSLLPIVLFPLTGGLASADTTSSYADDTIFLFLGGFIIALALEKWNLHQRIAINIMLIVGTSTYRIILGIMVATGFLSMWISNSATAMMMLPIAMSVVTHLEESLSAANKKEENFGKAAMLSVAYAASIGGLATLIGTPPNTILAGVVKKLFGVEITFAQWMLFGVPFAVILLIFVYFYLTRLAFPLKIKEIPGGRELIQEQKKQLGAMSSEEKKIAVVFVLTALAWIFRSFIIVKFIPSINDTTIAIIAAVILFLLPSKKAENGRLLEWGDAKEVPWGILLLFGGGLAIAKGFSDSGLAQWIGERLSALQNVPLIVIVFAVCALVLALTEITSNTATATMMFPIMASLALALNVHPFALMVAAGVSAASAFMLPVATPPNAVVFGTGLVRITEMVKAGFWINIFCIISFTLLIYFYLPLVWGIDIHVYPPVFK